MLREDTVFGPIFSRRLGSSLGINLLPQKGKIWDNRFMAAEEKAQGYGLGVTTFRKVSGGSFYPGMLIREIK